MARVGAGMQALAALAAMTAKRKHHGSSLDDFLSEEGALEQTRAVAIKEVIAWQIEKAMAERELSKAGMAEL